MLPGYPDIKSQIIQYAWDLGFDIAGVTTADPPPHYPAYIEWLECEFAGSMDYLGTETSRMRRADPRNILPECQCILVLGMRYAAPPPVELDDVGRVAAYAWGHDYHEILVEKMKQLVQCIENIVGHPVPNRYYTDTGPILERDIAQRAGLGWAGKNTCLIIPGKGSYYFLAEIILGLSLEPDPPFRADHCGSCTRCLEACPTGCILPDRVLDATRCISYLTIENKGPIPPALRASIGTWLFGCDVCQSVCPWNIRFAGNDRVAPEWLPPTIPPGIPLHHELRLTPVEFNHKYKNSPIKRAKRRGVLRNAAVVLGNIKDPAAIPDLINAMQHDQEPLVRGHAAWALGQFQREMVIESLANALGSETDPYVRDEIEAALQNLTL